MIRQRSDIAGAQRIVVKIGSSLLAGTDADSNSGVQMARVQRFADDIAALHATGKQVVVVSSGAVALGRVHLAWVDRKLSVHEQQAAAAIGQPALMHAYKQAFAGHGIGVAQMLLTADDLRNRRRYLNASNTGETLFAAGVVPFVTENDTVVVQEIKFGDNDNLGALVSLLLDADLLVIMTDVDALYDANPVNQPAANRIGLVESISPEILAMAGESGSRFGTGGMASKLKAASIATRGGVATAVVSGETPGMLAALIAGEDVGTLFACGEDRQSRRQHWIAEVLQPVGRIQVDKGAARAVLAHGASLLPVGVRAVEGEFDKGECVEIVADARVIARGLCNYSAEEMRILAGAASEDIERVLGYRDFSSLVHRDNLVLMGSLKQELEP
ncbi:MAG: glutamate 5-kinase [Mariprofundaceae bacterium]|nr:glutamate 5-kinase [Mariprofundaceae bacterium]